MVTVQRSNEGLGVQVWGLRWGEEEKGPFTTYSDGISLSTSSTSKPFQQNVNLVTQIKRTFRIWLWPVPRMVSLPLLSRLMSSSFNPLIPASVLQMASRERQHVRQISTVCAQAELDGWTERPAPSTHHICTVSLREHLNALEDRGERTERGVGRF